MDTQAQDNRQKKFWLYIVLALVLLAMASCVAGIRSFFDEDRNPATRITALKTMPANRLDVNASVISTDPARGLMKVELVFHPLGDLVAGSRHLLTRDIRLLTNAVGKTEILLKKNHAAQPLELTLSLLDGDIALYPADKYNALLELDASTQNGAEAEVPLPLVLYFTSHNHLLHAEASLGADSQDSDLQAEIKLTRPMTIQAFAWFMHGVMVLIGISAAMVTYNVAYKGKKLEAGLMIWMGALLFVLPSIRSMLPGVPPLGSFTDYLVFFWVEAATSLCLFIMVVTWYQRAPDDK